MAEAFARAYGSDIVAASSAGLLPSRDISKYTRMAMQERNIPLGRRKPRLLSSYRLAEFDLVVNMTGQPVQFPGAGAVVDWDVPDPAGKKLPAHRAVRDLIESRVRNLVARLRFGGGPVRRQQKHAPCRHAGALVRLVLLAALASAPAFSTPLYGEAALLRGIRAAPDLIALGVSADSFWIGWQIEPLPGGDFLYRYNFGGQGLAAGWALDLETEILVAMDALHPPVIRRRVTVSFPWPAAPVWGNFALSGSNGVLVLNAGWFDPHSERMSDFIARPGRLEPEPAPVSEPAPWAVLLTVLSGGYFILRHQSGTAAIQ